MERPYIVPLHNPENWGHAMPKNLDISVDLNPKGL